MSTATSELVDQLRKEGYRVTTGYLQFLLREHPVLKPAGKLGPLYVWEPADIERLKAALVERGRGPVQRGEDAPPLRKDRCPS